MFIEALVEMISQGLCDITLLTLTDPDPFLNWVLYLCKYEKSAVIHVIMHMQYVNVQCVL